uniref:Uncharacterized protein n=1 Tax=viral metagenome TaxID=1070528 RepID=A0A6M3KWZ8_9ZZZZ
MPKAFDACVKGGGKVRTKAVGEKKYIRICLPKGGGDSIGGEVKTKKKKGK